MQNSKLKIKNYLPKALIVFLLIILAKSTLAAELYLKSSQDSYFPNEIFKAEIRLNVSSGENVTALEGHIKYNPQDLKALEFLKGNSILTYVDEPKINQEEGIVTFSGIIPGGYKGRLPGDPGESNLLGTIAFQVLKTNNLTTKIEASNNSRIYLDAGQELKSNLIFQTLEININSQEVVFNPLNELSSSKELDKIPPEEFTPEIIQINNEYFIAFNAQDKQSGIDHYEIRFFESNILGQLHQISLTEKAVNPHLLNISEIKNIIEVEAIDKAGNERIATLYPQIQIKWYQNYWLWGIIIILVILGLIIGRLFKLKKRL
jgi:hypothetical protein